MYSEICIILRATDQDVLRNLSVDTIPLYFAENQLLPAVSAGGLEQEAGAEELFEIPSVQIKSSGKRSKSKKSKKTSKKALIAPNPFEDSDSDDLLPFIKEPKKGKKGGVLARSGGVGKEAKMVSYHDDDDEDLLEG